MQNVLVEFCDTFVQHRWQILFTYIYVPCIKQATYKFCSSEIISSNMLGHLKCLYRVASNFLLLNKVENVSQLLWNEQVLCYTTSRCMYRKNRPIIV